MCVDAEGYLVVTRLSREAGRKTVLQRMGLRREAGTGLWNCEEIESGGKGRREHEERQSGQTGFRGSPKIHKSTARP